MTTLPSENVLHQNVQEIVIDGCTNVVISSEGVISGKIHSVKLTSNGCLTIAGFHTSGRVTFNNGSVVSSIGQTISIGSGGIRINGMSQGVYEKKQKDALKEKKKTRDTRVHKIDLLTASIESIEVSGSTAELSLNSTAFSSMVMVSASAGGSLSFMKPTKFLQVSFRASSAARINGNNKVVVSGMAQLSSSSTGKITGFILNGRGSCNSSSCGTIRRSSTHPDKIRQKQSSMGKVHLSKYNRK